MIDATARTAASAIRATLEGENKNGYSPEALGDWWDTYHAIADVPLSERAQMYRVLDHDGKLTKLLAADATTPGGWGAVLPFEDHNLPPFPLDIFPPWLRDFCEAVTEQMQTPPDLAGMLALSILSAACARFVQVEVRPGWLEPINVYTVTSLPPGSRKSPVFRAMTAPLVAYEQALFTHVEIKIERAEAERDVLKQQLETAKRDAAKAKGDSRSEWDKVDDISTSLRNLVVPVPPKLIVDDITPETLSSAIVDQGGRIAVLSPEGDIFGIMAGRYSSGPPNLGVYLKGHPGDPLRVDRRTRSELVYNPALTVGVTTQPDVIRSFGATAAFRGQGLIARFFYALPVSTIGSRAVVTAPIPQPIREEYHAAIRRLLNLARYFGDCGNCGSLPAWVYQGGFGENDIFYNNNNNTSNIVLSIDSNNILTSYHERLEPQMGPYGSLASMSDWAAKLPGGIARVAGLLHMAALASHNSHNSHNQPDEITADTMQAAIRLAGYLLAHAKAAYQEIGSDPEVESARVVIRWIEKTQARDFTKRDCYQGVKGTVKRADELDSVLALLTDHGYIREAVTVEERGGPGRKPSQKYETNPAMFAHYSHNSQNR